MSHSSFNPQTPNGGAGIYLLRNIAFHTLTDLRLPMSRGGGKEESFLINILCVFPLSSMVPLINSHQRERERGKKKKKKTLSGHFFCAIGLVVGSTRGSCTLLPVTPLKFISFFFFPFYFLAEHFQEIKTQSPKKERKKEKEKNSLKQIRNIQTRVVYKKRSLPICSFL